MATHSSILAYKIKWTKEPGGLQSIESQSQTWLNDHAHSYACIIYGVLTIKWTREKKMLLRWLYRLTDLIHIKCFLVAQLVKNHLQCRRPRFDSWAGKICRWRDRLPTPVFSGFHGGSDSKESARNAGDLGLISRSGRSPGEENGNLL